jgi:hypothetical protein
MDMRDTSIWNSTMGRPLKLFLYEEDGEIKTGYTVDGNPLVLKYDDEDKGENNG